MSRTLVSRPSCCYIYSSLTYCNSWNKIGWKMIDLIIENANLGSRSPLSVHTVKRKLLAFFLIEIGRTCPSSLFFCKGPLFWVWRAKSPKMPQLRIYHRYNWTVSEVYTSVEIQGCARDAPPSRFKFFHFQAIIGKTFCLIIRWRTPKRGWRPLRNHRSVTAHFHVVHQELPQ